VYELCGIDILLGLDFNTRLNLLKKSPTDFSKVVVDRPVCLPSIMTGVTAVWLPLGVAVPFIVSFEVQMTLVESGLVIFSVWRSLDERFSFGHLLWTFQKRHTSRNTDHTYETHQSHLCVRAVRTPAFYIL
jgi:hypothetical protein